MTRPLSILQVIAVLLLLFGLWIGGWMLAFTEPQFASLQRDGLQKNARVIQKLLYRSICSGRTCKLFVLRVSFFTGAGGTQIPTQKVDLGKLVFAELEVNEAEYTTTQVNDHKKIVFLERNPEQVWLAETALTWQPWTNYTLSLVLFGIGMLLWNRPRHSPRG